MKYGIAKSFPFYARFSIPRMPRWMVRRFQKFTRNSFRCLYNRTDVQFTQYFKPYAEWSTQKAEGCNELEIDVIEPVGESDGKRPVLFYIHGGAFMWDAQKHHYELAARYAREAGVVVVMPRYRLTPASGNPAQLSDCRFAWQWMIDHAEELNIDAEHAGIGGDSAGGMLASLLTVWAVEEGYDPAFQMMLYPVIDPFMRTASMKRYTLTPIWNARLNKEMFLWFYGDRACMHTAARMNTSILDQVFLPENMPPVWVETAEYDCLHDEGVAYAEKLAAAGASVLLEETRGTMHGFDMFHCDVTENAVKNRIAFIREQCGSPAENLVLYGKTRFN